MGGPLAVTAQDATHSGRRRYASATVETVPNPSAHGSPGSPGPFEPLEAKRMLVVGASAGIGRAIAIQAVRSGARVALAARRTRLLEAAVEESGRPVAADPESAGPDSVGPESAGPDSLGPESAGTSRPAASGTRRRCCERFLVRCDRRARRPRMVDEATGWLGGLDVVVYAAGAAHLRAARGARRRSVVPMLATNVVGAAVVVAQALPALQRRRPARSPSCRRTPSGAVAVARRVLSEQGGPGGIRRAGCRSRSRASGS